MTLEVSSRDEIEFITVIRQSNVLIISGLLIKQGTDLPCWKRLQIYALISGFNSVCPVAANGRWAQPRLLVWDALG
jgi:hypothetical protein